MNLYLARHGESELNAQKVHQFAHTPLSEKGKQQAIFLARRVENLEIQHIFASDLRRAQQTAEIIQRHLEEIREEEIPLDTTSLLAEITRPSVLLGKSVNDPQVLEIKRAILDHYHEPDWRHSDEENFVLSKARAFRCLEFLQQRQESTVLCVTHGLNLALIVCCMVFGNEVTSHEYLKFVEHVYTKNTGLTWCTYENGKWRLVTWNDHAHLAE